MQSSVIGWLMGALLAASAAETARAPLSPPAPEAVPDGALGELVRYGERLLSDTRHAGQAFAKADLNCSSCHLGRGRVANAAPWAGLWGVFPEYRPRAGRFISIEDRVNDCFARSMNGQPPAPGSREMLAILAYLRWLSEGVPTGTAVVGRGFARVVLPSGVTANASRGERVYATRCAQCHGKDGGGMEGDGFFYPPLWGPKSFNIGAGMARVSTAAAFVKANMPYGQGNTLTDLEAYDVALYFTHKPRPDFAGKTRDWPNGDKPADARY